MFSPSVLHSTHHHCPITALAHSLWRQSKSPRTWTNFEAHLAKDLGMHQQIGDCHTSKQGHSRGVLANGHPEARGKTMLFSWLQEAGWWQPVRAHPEETRIPELCWSLHIPRWSHRGFGRAATATPGPSTDTVGNFRQQNNTLAVPKATAISNSVSNQVTAFFHSPMTRLSSMQRVVAEIDCGSHGKFLSELRYCIKTVKHNVWPCISAINILHLI